VALKPEGNILIGFSVTKRFKLWKELFQMLMEANETLAVRNAFYRVVIYLQYACYSTEQGIRQLKECGDGEVRETV
jgi:hypothetical protein